MLTEELTSTLRAHADDVDAPRSSLLVDLEHRIITSRRRRRAGATGAAVLLVVGVTIGVVAASISPGRKGQSPPVLTDATSVPCATPAREVPDYLDWPCPEGTLTPYDREAIHHLLTFTTLSPTASNPNVKPPDVAVRVLAMGPLPNSRAGSTVVHAEVWQRDGTGPATIVTSYGFHASAAPRWARPRNGDEWVPGGDAMGTKLPGDPVMFLDVPPGLDLPRRPDECQHMADTKPNKRHGGYFAACTDTVVTRAGVANVRTIGPHGQLGALDRVTDGLAGLDTTRSQRPNWRIQALDASGNVIGSIPFT
jgi:hypothetical protein